jgi:anti-sigma factor RsiW
MEHQHAVATLASERYLLGEMTDVERDSFEEHFFSCADCADDVRAAAAMKDGVRRGLASAKVVPIRRAWRPAIAIPWAAAATLAIVAGYESVHTRQDPMGGFNSPLALAPATLRPASRGQEPVVQPGPGGIITLAIDVRGAEGRIKYELRRADQTVVASSDVAAPQPGAPLLLVVPAGLLQPGTSYMFVTEPQNAGLTGEEYRFRVESR